MEKCHEQSCFGQTTAKLREGEAKWTRTGTSANPTSPNQPNQNRIQCKSQAKLLWAVTCCDCTLKLGTPKLPHWKFNEIHLPEPIISMVFHGFSMVFHGFSMGFYIGFHSVPGKIPRLPAPVSCRPSQRAGVRHGALHPGETHRLWTSKDRVFLEIFTDGGFHKWRYHQMDGL